ncbi:hypothetical protein H4Q26_015782 [Puccinia striiformis f. sp. tritici PST-130]|nr:hypothetical protein H4Q26_015782 [Puccinia striiformis f. sp. tritici PST-130]
MSVANFITWETMLALKLNLYLRSWGNAQAQALADLRTKVDESRDNVLIIKARLATQVPPNKQVLADLGARIIRLEDAMTKGPVLRDLEAKVATLTENIQVLNRWGDRFSELESKVQEINKRMQVQLQSTNQLVNPRLELNTSYDNTVNLTKDQLLAIQASTDSMQKELLLQQKETDLIQDLGKKYTKMTQQVSYFGNLSERNQKDNSAHSWQIESLHQDNQLIVRRQGKIWDRLTGVEKSVCNISSGNDKLVKANDQQQLMEVDDSATKIAPYNSEAADLKELVAKQYDITFVSQLHSLTMTIESTKQWVLAQIQDFQTVFKQATTHELAMQRHSMEEAVMVRVERISELQNNISDRLKIPQGDIVQLNQSKIEGRLLNLEKDGEGTAATLSEVKTGIELLKQDNKLLSQHQKVIESSVVGLDKRTNQLHLDLAVFSSSQMEHKKIMNLMKISCHNFLESQNQNFSYGLEQIKSKVSSIEMVGRRNEASLAEAKFGMRSLTNNIQIIQHHQTTLDNRLIALQGGFSPTQTDAPDKTVQLKKQRDTLASASSNRLSQVVLFHLQFVHSKN